MKRRKISEQLFKDMLEQRKKKHKTRQETLFDNQEEHGLPCNVEFINGVLSNGLFDSIVPTQTIDIDCEVAPSFYLDYKKIGQEGGIPDVDIRIEQKKTPFFNKHISLPMSTPRSVLAVEIAKSIDREVLSDLQACSSNGERFPSDEPEEMCEKIFDVANNISERSSRSANFVVVPTEEIKDKLVKGLDMRFSVLVGPVRDNIVVGHKGGSWLEGGYVYTIKLLLSKEGGQFCCVVRAKEVVVPTLYETIRLYGR